MTRRPAPYVELSVMARVEAHRKNIYRPPYYVHKWWARRIGSVFRGIALDMLLSDDEDVMDAAIDAARDCDVFLAVGTSLGVYPAAGLVDLAQGMGARLVVVNAEPTPYDGGAEAVVRDPIDEALPRLLSAAG